MRRNKKHYIILGIIQCIIAIGAIPAGLAFTLDPSGNSNGGTTEILANSPFPDFLIPGLFLLIVHGIGNVLGAFFSFRRMDIAGKAGIFLGVAQFLWIIFQVAWIGLSSALQPIFFFIGITEAVFGYLIYKKVRRLTNS